MLPERQLLNSRRSIGNSEPTPLGQRFKDLVTGYRRIHGVDAPVPLDVQEEMWKEANIIRIPLLSRTHKFKGISILKKDNPKML